MVLLATVATVIASQAVISGAFSLGRQAAQLGYLPRLTVRHTSSAEIGQVYLPAINWIVLIAVVMLVLGFRSSANLAAAYGVAVTGTILITTILFFTVARARWRIPFWMALAGVWCSAALTCCSSRPISASCSTAAGFRSRSGSWCSVCS